VTLGLDERVLRLDHGTAFKPRAQYRRGQTPSSSTSRRLNRQLVRYVWVL
jgi:hypothetical protein